MDFFDVVQKRRSVRGFTAESFPDELVNKALEAAVLAPNSSNTQTWDFHWIKNGEIRKKVISACLDQSAARNASQIVVVSADPKNWKRSQKPLIEFFTSTHAPEKVHIYYKRLIPFVYSWGFLNLFGYIKIIFSFVGGLFRPLPRGPNTKRDNQEVAVKSAALACENFVLAVTALGGAIKNL